jgi:hypothetical protein
MPKPMLGGIVPQSFLQKALPIAEREGGIPTLASMINRFHNPSFGRNYQSWLTPDQYEVLRSPAPRDAGSRLRARLATPQGQQELLKAGQELGGVTDFRSTKYLEKTGNLMKYPDNLIPVLQGSQRVFMTPDELRRSRLKPDPTENTFFNESKRPPTKAWWQQSEVPVETRQPEIPGTASNTVISSSGIQQAIADRLAQELLKKTMQNQSALGNISVLSPLSFGEII